MYICGYSLMVKRQLPKLVLRVRFPLSAVDRPIKKDASLHFFQSDFLCYNEREIIIPIIEKYDAKNAELWVPIIKK